MRYPSNSILRLLARLGPSLTSDLALELRKSGISPAAARQRLSRLPEEVKTLFGLPFPKRARFIYLQDQFGTAEYWDALIEAVQSSNPAHAAALAGLQARGGIVPVSQFAIVSGAPLRQKRQLSSKTIMERLVSVSLLSRDQVMSLGECVSLGTSGLLGDVAITSLRARLLTERVLLDGIKGWAGRMNLASPNTTQVRDRDTTPQYATFAFDICGPSYLRPLRRLLNFLRSKARYLTYVERFSNCWLGTWFVPREGRLT